MDALSWATGLKPSHVVWAAILLFFGASALAGAVVLILAASGPMPDGLRDTYSGRYRVETGGAIPRLRASRLGTALRGASQGFWSNLPFMKSGSESSVAEPAGSRLESPGGGGLAGASPGAPAPGGSPPAIAQDASTPDRPRQAGQDRWGFLNSESGGSGAVYSGSQAGAGSAGGPGAGSGSTGSGSAGRGEADQSKPSANVSLKLPAIPSVEGAPAAARAGSQPTAQSGTASGRYDPRQPGAAGPGAPIKMIDMDSSLAQPLSSGSGPGRGKQDSLMDQGGSGSVQGGSSATPR